MKLIINERQFQLIENILLEDKASSVVPNLKVGDKLILTSESGTKLTFEVVKTDVGGQVWLKNLDKGTLKNYIIFFSQNDIVNDELKYKFVHKEKEKELLNKSPSTWKSGSFKNLSSIQVFDKSKTPKGTIDVKKATDTGKKDTKTEPKKDGDSKKGEVDDLVRELNSMTMGDDYEFTLDDNSKLIFNVINKGAGFTALDLKEVKGGEASRYKELMGDDLEFEASSKNVKLYPGEEYKFDILLTRWLGGEDESSGEAKSKSEKVIIQGIVDLDNVKHKVDKNDEESDDEVMDLVFDNPRLRKAFMAKPTFWDALLNRDPKGLIRARKILDKLGMQSSDSENIKSKDTIYEKFNDKQEVKFELLNKDFEYKKGDKDILIDAYSKYMGKIRRNSKSKTVSIKRGDVLIKLNKIVKDSDNTYRATVIVPMEGDDYEENRTIKVYNY
jgi:hypothetical protein